MENWRKVSVEVESNPSETFKQELSKNVNNTLKNILKDDVEEMMIEYISIMVLNKKTMGEISESLKDLVEEKQAEMICKDLYNKYKVEKVPEVTPVIKRKRDEERLTESFSTKNLRASRKQRLHNEDSSKYDTNLINAYKLYLESNFPKGFLEYQLYLKGELSLEDSFPQKHSTRGRGRGRSRGRGRFMSNSRGRGRGRGSFSNTYTRVGGMGEISGLEANVKEGEKVDLFEKKQRIQNKIKAMSYVREDLPQKVQSNIKIKEKLNPDATPWQPIQKKNNKTWVRPGLKDQNS